MSCIFLSFIFLVVQIPFYQFPGRANSAPPPFKCVSFLSFSSACFFLNYPGCVFLILLFSRCDFLPFYMVWIFQHFQEVPFFSLIFQVCVFFVSTDSIFSSILLVGNFPLWDSPNCSFYKSYQFHVCIFCFIPGYVFSGLWQVVYFRFYHFPYVSFLKFARV